MKAFLMKVGGSTYKLLLECCSKLSALLCIFFFSFRVHKNVKEQIGKC